MSALGELKVKLLLASVIMASATVFAAFVPNPARANTYTLALTDTGNSTYSGTGTLVIVGAPSPTNSYDDFCLSNGCGGGTLTSLSFRLNNGDTFSTSDSGVSGVSAVFDDGTLQSIGFYDNFSTYQFTITSDLDYTYHFYSPQFTAGGTISLATTPLPATLPLFAGGLGAMGLFGWRKKRKSVAAAA
jgi:hypothetical protein